MGRLILHMITSIDGFISDHDDAVNPETQWDEEVQRFYLDRLNTAEAVAANTRILTGDIAAELAELKQKAAGDLLLMCGPALLAHLTAARLVDEYMLYVCPSALGAGTHLLRDISDHVKLRCTRSVSFTTGVNLHIYKPVHPPTSASTVLER